jgi:hypothetical protein
MWDSHFWLSAISITAQCASLSFRTRRILAV